MRGFLTRLVITALGLWLASAIVHGVTIVGVGTLLLAALLLGMVNAFVRPVLFVLTLPITIFTLGLFLLVVNGITFALVAWLLPGFTVSGLGAATVGALVVTITSWFANGFVGSSGRLERYAGRRIEVPGRRIG
jgi:putative membrane protein